MRILLLSLLLAVPISHAAEYESLYRDGKFGDALSALEKEKSQVGEFAYVFNKGVIHHALGQEGLAVAYLEKAHALKPQDSSIDEPLETARLAHGKLIGIHRLDPATYGFERLGDLLPLDFLFVVAGGFFAAALLFFMISNRRFNRNWGWIFAFSAGLALIFGAWTLWMEEHPAYVLIADANVKSGPQAGVIEKGVLYVGTKVRRAPFEERDGYVRIRFSTEGDEGFIDKKSLLLLTEESNK